MNLGAITATTVAALAAGVVLGACGSSVASKSGSAGSGERTLRLKLPPPVTAGVDGDFTPIFHHRRDFSPGDSFIKWGRFVQGGFYVEHCVIARQQPVSAFQCSRTYVLSAGQIVAVGDTSLPDDGPSTYPVAGGTGAYEGAHGSVAALEGRRGGSHTLKLR
jgi:hypothetical protein